MAAAAPRASAAVRYSQGGRERVWCAALKEEGHGGIADARDLVRRFAEAAGRASAEGVELRVVPARPGRPQAEVAPAAGQSLAAFLGLCCREDHGAFQLRAVFDAPSGDGLVQVCVAFPGTAPATAAAAGGEAPPMIVEQFECKVTQDIGSLKRMIESRTRFPVARGVLLLGCRRLHDELPAARAAAAADTAGTPLQLHLAASGAYMFLRREGQGHCEPTGPCSLTLLLPPCVQGARARSMRFDPAQRLCSLRWSAQAVSGLPLASMQLTLSSPTRRPLMGSDDGKLLDALGLVDGCTLRVECDLDEESMLGATYDLAFDSPVEGNAAALYGRAAARLGIADVSRLALFAGDAAINRNADLSCAPLADGVVLSAYVACSLQLSVSVFTRRGGDAEHPAAALPAAIACFSSDTVGEVRERAIGAAAATWSETAARLRGSRAFAVDRAAWAAGGSECGSLGSLARLLGHFTPCSESVRLSRLGIADGEAHLVFVPEQQLLVEIAVFVSGEPCAIRRLRVAGATRLQDLAGLLEQSLRDEAQSDGLCGPCQWAAGAGSEAEPADRANARAAAHDADGSVGAASPSRAVAAMVGTAAAALVPKGRRRSFGWSTPEKGGEKRRRLNPVNELSDTAFVGDVHARHPAGPKELPRHYLCPISFDVMRDPVLVVGSGNTYDRRCIERHFKQRHADPLSNVELPRAADRRLVPNNSLRSQIDEAERSQVDVRLAAFFGERQRSPHSGDAPVAAYLGWAASLLRGSP